MSQVRRSVLHGFAAITLAVLILIGCGGDDESTSLDPPTTTSAVQADASADASAGVDPVFQPSENPEVLSGWGQLQLRDGHLIVADGVTPYTLNSPLFSDHAQKLRTVWLPSGVAAAAYDPQEVFDFPIGSVITKTFYYPRDANGAASDTTDQDGIRVSKAAPNAVDAPRSLDLGKVRLMETRVLARRESGWVALPYVWNDEQTEATLERTGDLVPLTLTDGAEETSFPYVVPNINQCAGCHATNHTTGALQPIGPKARHLNTDVDLGSGMNAQLTQWAELGLVRDLPDLADVPRAAVWNDDTATLDARARAYLDINCAHCHNRNGPADTSGLFLETTTELGPRLGVCKPPVAAGTGTGNRRVGINPGHPDDSIFVFRMTTTDPGAMMPELGRALVHEEGVELISDWIASLDGTCS